MAVGLVNIWWFSCCSVHFLYSMFRTDHRAPVTHGSWLSAGGAAPGICVARPVVWPAGCFGRTELKREDKLSRFT